MIRTSFVRYASIGRLFTRNCMFTIGFSFFFPWSVIAVEPCAGALFSYPLIIDDLRLMTTSPFQIEYLNPKGVLL